VGRERVTEIMSRVSAIQAERQLKKTQVVEEKQRRLVEQEVKHLQNIQALEATGVPDFFREIIQEGILTSSPGPVYEERRVFTGILGLRRTTKMVKTADFDPAIISFHDFGPSVKLRFNRYTGMYNDLDSYVAWRSIEVSIGNYWGGPSVDRKKLEEGQDLISAVTDRVVFWLTK